MARPVVATRFPYSEEVLGSGAGLVVEHEADAIASAVRGLVDDPIAYRRAVREATRISENLSWDLVAERYVHLIRELAPTAATA
jgi:glycosyltransferase involved in cell wall biosynthesis